MTKKLCLALIVIAVACFSQTECKNVRHNHALKKVSKPTKGPKSIVDAFKGLPEDDIAFIKQLDKQFKKFGDNIKIKIQKENRTTTTSKNSKRTIDGSLGYGYQTNSNKDQGGSYTFSKPKYDFYPYSQHDIPAAPEYQQQQHHVHYLRNYPQALVESDPNYYQNQHAEDAHGKHTAVEIQASHSYEIKQTEDGYKTIYNGNDDHQHHEAAAYRSEQNEAVPVIVLRIPGPPKYAAHLQTLLQQYLEIRAAQYIQALQEQEARGLEQTQSYEHAQYDEQAYQQPLSVPVVQQYQHQPQAYVAQPLYVQPLQYPAPISGFQPSLADPNADPHVETHDEQHVVATPSPAAYYNTHASAHTHTDDAASDEHHAGIVHPASYAYHTHHNDGSEQQESHEGYGDPHHETISDHSALLTTENFPSDKHTQVIFKSTTASPLHHEHHEHENEHELEQHEQHYIPPVTQIKTYKAPLVYHKLEQYYNTQYDDQSEQVHDHHEEEHSGYDENAQPISSTHSKENYVTITQRPAVLPYNYHSQLAQLAHYGDDLGFDYATTPAEDDNLYKRSSITNNKKRQSIQSREDRYRKFTTLAQRMKSRMTAVTPANDEEVKA